MISAANTMVERTAPRHRETDPSDAPVTRKALRILLVEDDDVDAKLITLFASASSRFAVEIVRAVSTGEASRLSETERFDAVILDFWLGCESSLRFLACLSGKEACLPALILTSLSTPDIRQLCDNAGAKRFLGKGSLSTETLEQAIGYLLAGPLPETARAMIARPGPGDLNKVIRAMDEADLRTDVAGAPTDATRRHPADHHDLSRLQEMTEPVRYGLFERLVAQRRSISRLSSRDQATDIAAIVDLAVDLLRAVNDGRGQTFAVAAPVTVAPRVPDEASLLFVMFELANRASAQSASDSRISVAIDCVGQAWAVTFASRTKSDSNATSTAFGPLFMDILLDLSGTIQNGTDPDGRLVLIARFDGGPAATVSPTGMH